MAELVITPTGFDIDPLDNDSVDFYTRKTYQYLKCYSSWVKIKEKSKIALYDSLRRSNFSSELIGNTYHSIHGLKAIKSDCSFGDFFIKDMARKIRIII